MSVVVKSDSSGDFTSSPINSSSVRSKPKHKHNNATEADTVVYGLNDEDEEQFSPTDSDQQSQKRQKITRRSVACKSCHSLKVKCTPSNPQDPGASCVRCLNANRKCEIDLNQTRKRRKKAEILEAKKKEAEKEMKEVEKEMKDAVVEKKMKKPASFSQTLPSPVAMPLVQTRASSSTIPSIPSNLNPASYSPSAPSVQSAPPVPAPPPPPPPLLNIHPQLPSPKFDPQIPLSKDQEIASLKQRIRMLETQLMHRHRKSYSQQGIQSDSSTDSPPFISKFDLEQEIAILGEASSKLTDVTNELNLLADRRTRMLRSSIPPDVVSKGFLTLAEADVRLNLYRDRILSFLPLVEIPVHLSADQFRIQQPFLFNAIMSVSNTVNRAGVNPDQALALDNEAIRSVCDEAMVVGTKSVEVIKSILVLSLYYNSPELFRQRRYHLLNTICVSLLHDLGIVSRPTYTFTEGTLKQDAEPKTSEEYRSLVLIIYFNTVSICLILRRSIYIKWTSYVEECCRILENSSQEKYRKLALFARINSALENIHHITHSSELDDKRPSTSMFIVSELQKRLMELRKKVKNDDHVFLSYLHSVEAYLCEPNFTNMFNRDDSSLSSRAVKAISDCTNSCLAALNEYTQLSSDEVAQMPLAFGSRVMYTGGMLLRLRYLIMSLSSHIDKDLVPRDAVIIIQKVCRLVEQSHLQHPDNHLLKKTRLVMQLFTQTYATQIEELLFKNNSTPQNLKPFNSNVEKPLDILSLAAYHSPYQPKNSTPQEHEFRDYRLPSISMDSQNIYNTINDEFWSNLISTDTDHVNFINSNNAYDEIFFN
ncbi:WAR1 [Candida oxycetoniae]|uniref:WAR1 n=1 Tax=Candida oxycetoniae TaxID=497107 RepID=A0AAI9SXR3_9ASCO|nr:WAR1 [Candida oxycetoniae]KAI3404657.2 WAR1 [Candida oxycetoniae]